MCILLPDATDENKSIPCGYGHAYSNFYDATEGGIAAYRLTMPSQVRARCRHKTVILYFTDVVSFIPQNTSVKTETILLIPFFHTL
jgi:hypothetical protein